MVLVSFEISYKYIQLMQPLILTTVNFVNSLLQETFKIQWLLEPTSLIPIIYTIKLSIFYLQKIKK